MFNRKRAAFLSYSVRASFGSSDLILVCAAGGVVACFLSLTSNLSRQTPRFTLTGPSNPIVLRSYSTSRRCRAAGWGPAILGDTRWLLLLDPRRINDHCTNIGIADHVGGLFERPNRLYDKATWPLRRIDLASPARDLQLISTPFIGGFFNPQSYRILNQVNPVAYAILSALPVEVRWTQDGQR